MSVGFESQLCATEELSSLVKQPNSFRATILGDAAENPLKPTSIQDARRSGEWYEQHPNYEMNIKGCAGNGSPLSPKPITLLETSQNFFPETYTTDSRLPRSCLVVISSYEQWTRADSKTNIYTILLLKSPRKWLRLTVSINIPYLSRYWTGTKTTLGEHRKWQRPFLAGGGALPYSLLTKIHAFLCQDGGIDDDTTTFLSLSNQDTIQRQPQTPHIDASSTKPKSLSPFSDALNFLHDLGCPRYIESDVVQIEMLDPPNRFASCINGTLVFEIKFTGSDTIIELLYNIRVLNCMNGAPGFAKLVGVVTDNSGKHLKSYLVEFPKARWNILQIAGHPSVPWECREKWAVQLVDAISQLHARGCVAGIASFSMPVVIESTDCIQFWSYRKRLVVGRRVSAYYPPEFRYLRDMSPTTDEAEIPHVTTKMDIFHLGQLL